MGYIFFLNHVCSVIDKTKLKEIFKAFLEDLTKNGKLTIQVENNVCELCFLFALSQEELFMIMLGVQQKVYRTELRDHFSNDRLEVSSSKAALLNNLSQRINLCFQLAEKVNCSILSRRYEQLVSGGKLAKSHLYELEKLNPFLCITEKDFRIIKKGLSGEI